MKDYIKWASIYIDNIHLIYKKIFIKSILSIKKRKR